MHSFSIDLPYGQVPIPVPRVLARAASERVMSRARPADTYGEGCGSTAVTPSSDGVQRAFRTRLCAGECRADGYWLPAPPVDPPPGRRGSRGRARTRARDARPSGRISDPHARLASARSAATWWLSRTAETSAKAIQSRKSKSGHVMDLELKVASREPPHAFLAEIDAIPGVAIKAVAQSEEA
jgi:hypothetical protein